MARRAGPARDSIQGYLRRGSQTLRLLLACQAWHGMAWRLRPRMLAGILFFIFISYLSAEFSFFFLPFYFFYFSLPDVCLSAPCISLSLSVSPTYWRAPSLSAHVLSLLRPIRGEQSEKPQGSLFASRLTDAMMGRSEITSRDSPSPYRFGRDFNLAAPEITARSRGETVSQPRRLLLPLSSSRIQSH